MSRPGIELTPLRTSNLNGAPSASSAHGAGTPQSATRNRYTESPGAISSTLPPTAQFSQESSELLRRALEAVSEALLHFGRQAVPDIEQDAAALSAPTRQSTTRGTNTPSRGHPTSANWRLVEDVAARMPMAQTIGNIGLGLTRFPLLHLQPCEAGAPWLWSWIEKGETEDFRFWRANYNRLRFGRQFLDPLLEEFLDEDVDPLTRREGFRMVRCLALLTSRSSDVDQCWWWTPNGNIGKPPPDPMGYLFLLLLERRLHSFDDTQIGPLKSQTLAPELRLTNTITVLKIVAVLLALTEQVGAIMPSITTAGFLVRLRDFGVIDDLPTRDQMRSLLREMGPPKWNQQHPLWIQCIFYIYQCTFLLLLDPRRPEDLCRKTMAQTFSSISMQDTLDWRLGEFLEFWDVACCLPSAAPLAAHTLRKNTLQDLRVDDFDVDSLKRLGGLSIVWTDCLSDHLRLDRSVNGLLIYRNWAAFSAERVYQLNCGYCHWTKGRHNPTSFADEFELLWAVIFNQKNSPRRRLKTDRIKPPHPSFREYEDYRRVPRRRRLLRLLGIHTSCSHEIVAGTHALCRFNPSYPYAPMPSDNASEQRYLRLHRNGAILLADVPTYEERLLLLRRYMDERKPRTLFALWQDNRDTVNYYTFWGVLIVGIVTILLAVASLGVSIAQAVASFDALHLTGNDGGVGGGMSGGTGSRGGAGGIGSGIGGGDDGPPGKLRLP